MARKTKAMTGKKPIRKEDASGYPALGRALMWVDAPGNGKKIVYSLYAVCTALFFADFFYKKKTLVEIEYVPGFYAIYGFVMCAALVICAKWMRLIVKRPEDFYGDMAIDTEAYPEDQLERKRYDA
jgi:hypothetical protein